MGDVERIGAECMVIESGVDRDSGRRVWVVSWWEKEGETVTDIVESADAAEAAAAEWGLPIIRRP